MRTLPKIVVLALALLALAMGVRASAARLPDGQGQTRARGRNGSRWARRALFAIGAICVVASLALVSAVLYEDLREGQPETAAQTLAFAHQEPGAIYDRPIALTPSPAATPPSAAAAGPPPLRDSHYRMIITKVDVDAAVVTYGLDADQVPQVPLNKYDVAWYDFSARPGTGSNAVFAGHVTWSGEAVFYRLDALAPGDQVALKGDDGAELIYTISEVYLVDPADRAALAVMAPTSTDMMTIITCGGTFFYTGDPVFRGDYTNRLIVRATLTSVSAAGSAPAPASGG